MAAEKEVNPNGRADLLHEAEDILMADMPIIPVVFNMNVTMQSDELSKTDVTYYQTNVFTKTKQKNYEQYLTSAQ